MHTRHAGPGSTRPRRRAAARCSSALLVLLPLAAAGVTNAASIESIPTALIPTPRSISSRGTARTFAPACSVRSDSARDDVSALANDRLDALTLRRVAAEARLRAITFIPIVQTLAHQERLLSRPQMRRHAERDGASMFAITRPGTRALVRSMVDDVLAASGSR